MTAKKTTLKDFISIANHHDERDRRCKHMAGSVRCCLEEDHDDDKVKGHLYKCSSKHCPGLPWLASNTPHPNSCLKAKRAR